MATPLERLTAILCECESVKKDVMELRFGCIIKTAFWTYKKLVTKDKFFEKVAYIETLVCLNWQEEIIWNPIQDHHLRMYCEIMWIDITFSVHAWSTLLMNTSKKWFDTVLEHKHLHQQNDEILEKIIVFLENNLFRS